LKDFTIEYPYVDSYPLFMITPELVAMVNLYSSGLGWRCLTVLNDCLEVFCKVIILSTPYKNTAKGRNEQTEK
jgi:hypothetical protein